MFTFRCVWEHGNEAKLLTEWMTTIYTCTLIPRPSLAPVFKCIQEINRTSNTNITLAVGILQPIKNWRQERQTCTTAHRHAHTHTHSLTKEHPWVEHLTSLPKRRWVLFQVRLSMKECLCHVDGNSVPSKQ